MRQRQRAEIHLPSALLPLPCLYRVLMADFNIRTDAVDVEQIMRQIRARIQEKRGVDYTEQQIQELANVKLERFLDPKGVRSDLVEQFKRRDRKLEPFHLHPEPSHGFDAEMLYGTHRGILRLIRRLLNPILKLFFNPEHGSFRCCTSRPRSTRCHEGQFYFLREKIQQRDEVDVSVLRAGPQPRARADTGRHREPESQDAARVVVQPDGLRRAARARTRRGGSVSAGTGPARETCTNPSSDPSIESAPSRTAAGTTRPGTAWLCHRRARRRIEHSTPTPPASSRPSGRTWPRSRNDSRSGTPIETLSPEDSATPPHGDPTADAALESDHSEPDFESDSDSGEDEGPDPSAQ